MPKVRTNGIELHYAIRGEGEPLILLMGLGADGSAWERHTSEYERHFRCYLIDNRGSGASDKPPGPYSTREMAVDTIGLMDALGIDEAHVSGISMGGAIAQEVALQAPSRIRSLTLNCTWSACESVFVRRTFETLSAAYGAMRADDFAKLLHLIIYTPGYHERYADELTASGREALEGAADRMPAHAFEAQCSACLSHNTVGRLGAIAAPVLLTMGDNDRFTPPVLTEAIAAEIPQAELARFPGSGHTHHWDALERFNRVTTDFMLRHSRYSGGGGAG